jgi:hypothetical protein
VSGAWRSSFNFEGIKAFVAASPVAEALQATSGSLQTDEDGQECAHEKPADAESESSSRREGTGLKGGLSGFP